MAAAADVRDLFGESAAIMTRLRGPDGCPWDREQTPDSLRKYTLEETYEVLDAIEQRDWQNLCEELGDLLLQVLFYAQIAEEAGDFSLADVITSLNRKLVRRHPHVFGNEASLAAGNHAAGLPSVTGADADTAITISNNWRAIKEMESKSNAAHQPSRLPAHLAAIPRSQSALAEAEQLGSAAGKVGFDWPDARGLLEKVREEAAELELELAAWPERMDRAGTPKSRIAEEFGDLLFTAANLGRHLKLDPEIALRDANAKFRRRFESMEQATYQVDERRLEQLTPAELEQAWAAVKAGERR